MGAVLLLWLMLNRRSSLPRLYIAWWVLVVVTLLGDAAMHQLIPALAGDWTDKNSVELGRTCVFGVIWISYFLRSDRVRRTFVCRRRAATAPPDAAESAGSPAS